MELKKFLRENFSQFYPLYKTILEWFIQILKKFIQILNIAMRKFMELNKF